MLQKLRTVIYQVDDLDAAKKWYAELLGFDPYFDQAFYVGFNPGGFELGLDPDGSSVTKGNNAIAYWTVTGINECVARAVELGATILTAPSNVGDGITVATVGDPFGNTIGLIEELEAMAA